MDLINRSEARKIAKGFTFTFAEERQRYMDFLDYCLENTPTVDAVPVVHGEWKAKVRANNGYVVSITCSACGYAHSRVMYNFCPECGADMRDKNND